MGAYLKVCKGSAYSKNQYFLFFTAMLKEYFFFINNPFLTLVPKIVSAFLKNDPKNFFSNCLVDGLLTFIV